ncbi:MAG: Nif11-like leader peptide family natural product precursor [Planctomycetota bacterium]
MSVKNVKAFLAKADKDKDLGQKLRALITTTTGKDEKALPEFVQIGAEAGFKFTVDEARTALQQELDEISDKQLNAVAGGINMDDITKSLTSLGKSIASSLIKGCSW